MIIGHPSRAPSIKEVVWSPPLCFWVKCNSDGTARGALGIAACCGIFRDYRASTLGCFAANLGVSFSLHAKLLGAILAIEHASAQNWPNFWLESVSQLVVAAFKSPSIVPWTLRNRWNNCVALTKSMNFFVSHIYREGNSCADRLAAYDLANQSYFWWDTIPQFLNVDFFRNRVGLPSYRFC